MYFEYRSCNKCKIEKPLTSDYFIESDKYQTGYSRKCWNCHLTCNRCKTTKTIEDFHPNRGKPAGIDNRCRACQKVYVDRNNKRASHKVKMRARTRKHQAFISRVKTYFGCAICGYRAHAVAIDFDHLDPSTKRGDGYSAVNSSWSMKHIKNEIRKCRILCSNCHRCTTHGIDPTHDH